MGSCASAPVRRPGWDDGGGDRSKDAAPATTCQPWDAHSGGARAADVSPLRLRKASAHGSAGGLPLTEVHALQQQLSEVSHSPILGLVQQAELLTSELGCDTAAIWAITRDEAPAIVLLTACGEHAPALEAAAAAPAHPGAAALRPVVISDLQQQEAWRDLPAHLQGLLPPARSVALLPLGPVAQPLGMLLLADSRPGFFDGTRWQMRLQVAAMAVLRLVRHAQVLQAASILRALHAAPDALAAISILLRSSSRFMTSAANVRTAARLALVAGAPPGEALLFEAPRAPPAPRGRRASSLDGGAAANAGGGRAAPFGPRGCAVVEAGDSEAEVAASRMLLGNTLLVSALKHQQARFVKDIGVYMQACPFLAKDVFSRASDLVSSVVVVPLLGAGGGAGGAPLGGMYFSLEAPCDFENIRDTLLGFVHGVTSMLERRLAGQMDSLQAALAKASEARQSLLGAAPAEPSNSSGDGRGSKDASDASPAAPPSSRLSLQGPQFNTEAMLQVLQQEVRKGWRRRSHHQYLPELVVAECLATGRSGACYRGYWHKTPAAVKIMYVRGTEREAMVDAVEMAVLSSVQHPNVVKVYACLTDMVEAGAEDGSTTVSSISSAGSLVRPSRIRYRRLAPHEAAGEDLDLCNVLVMEYCDRGTLRASISGGLLHAPLPGGAVGVNLGAAVEVLLDVAYALTHLHSMQLVHGDIKADNVLLKTDPSRPLGLTPKLCNFGAAKILDDGDAAVNLGSAGTAAAHLAPELLLEGARVTAAVDAFAFGSLIWECYTGQRFRPRAAAAGPDANPPRPPFPPGAPPAYVELAASCWAADPDARPPLSEVAARLERIHLSLQQRAAAQAAAAAGAAAAEAAQARAAERAARGGGRGRPAAAPAALRAAGEARA